MSNKLLRWQLLTLTLLLTAGTSSNAIAGTVSLEETRQVASQNRLQIAQAEQDIVDLANSQENFSTLVKAIQAANLAETLKGEGPFTVFAPTNQAFAKLPDGLVEFLLQPENQDLLVDVLKYHVISGKVTSNELETGTVESLNGGISVAVSSDRIIINNASVVQADVEASNGVVHAVNRVLLPEGLAETIRNRMH